MKQIIFLNKSLERIADSLSPSLRQFIDSPEGRLRKKKWKRQ